MRTLLAIDTSPSSDSASRSLVDHFVTHYTTTNPGTTVVHRNIGTAPLAHLDDELINGLRKQPDVLTARQQSARDDSDAMVAEMAAADAIVIGAPMHNFTITSAFRTWIDHIARPGVTFGYDPETGPKGLLADKPVYVISTRGGKYGEADAANPHPADFQSDYIRHIFKFIGITNVQFIAANGMDMGNEPRAEGLEAAHLGIDAAIAHLKSQHAA